MNSSVTALSATSVMSSSRWEMRVSNRSNGPSKTGRETRKRPSSVGAASSGDGATGDQLPGQAEVRLGGSVLGGELGDRHARDGGVGELHGTTDHRTEEHTSELQ